jgi:hypothetical protein
MEIVLIIEVYEFLIDFINVIHIYNSSENIIFLKPFPVVTTLAHNGRVIFVLTQTQTLYMNGIISFTYQLFFVFLIWFIKI